MSAFTIALSLAVLLVAFTLVVRAATVNRLVARKLRLTLLLALASAVCSVGSALPQLPPQMATPLRDVQRLLLVLATVNFAVVVAINPLRADRVPARYPNIVQDAIVVFLFLLVATFVMEEKFLTTSAVGAVVVGFALQDTLGNAFAGLAIQVEKPFRVGQWIRIGEHEGRVEEITWRATKLRTRSSTYVVVPNNEISKGAIVNYSEPIVPTRVTLEVGASYLVPPHEVKAAVREAIGNASLARREPEPDVLLVEFGPSAMTYRTGFWVDEYGRDEAAKDQVRSNIYYAFRRRNIEIPWPIQVTYSRQELPGRPEAVTDRFARQIASIPVFGALSEQDRSALARSARHQWYGAGEVVVRQGDPGSSMFVVCSGRAVVTIDGVDTPVATIEAGDFTGEMSLLTGEPRAATVAAQSDTEVMEITSEAFRDYVLGKPDVLEAITRAVLERRVELERTRAAATDARTVSIENPATLLSRVRKFLRLDAPKSRPGATTAMP